MMPRDGAAARDEDAVMAALPRELAEMGAMLDRLAGAEGARCAGGLEGRVFAATRGMIGPEGGTGAAAGRVVEDLGELVAHERGAAGVAFEGRVFVATRAALRGHGRGTGLGTGLGHGQAGGGEVRVVPAAGRLMFMAPMVRMAAAVAVVGAGVAAWVALRPGETAVEEAGTGTMRLAQQADEKLEVLLAAEWFGATTDWSAAATDGMEDLSRDMDSLTMQVDGEWFQFGRLADEEAM